MYRGREIVVSTLVVVVEMVPVLFRAHVDYIGRENSIQQGRR